MANPITYHGVWHVPDARGMSTLRFSGTLTYFGDKPSKLELIHEPNSGSIATANYYEVLWGEDARGIKYTLFGATCDWDTSFTKIVYFIRYFLIGIHVNSLNDACFDTCWVKYPYLNRWALDNRFNIKKNYQETIVSLDLGARPSFLSVEIDDELRLMLWGHLTHNVNRFEITATQATSLNIDTPENAPLNVYIKTINEFSQFLSIALFAEQHPSEVIFANKGVKIQYPLFFDTQVSTDPWALSLIKYDALKSKMPEILRLWHSNYEQITPICNYLIRSIKNTNTFDAPDFLIVAQALDGYFKRFVNNKDGKDTKQYKQQIEKLLKAFNGVEAIKKCKIDAEVLTQTRHKYSHLIPDNDSKIAKAVEGEELFWLTQKCIVLLTCCILNLLGLTTEEINLCCQYSPIEQIINSIPTWE